MEKFFNHYRLTLCILDETIFFSERLGVFFILRNSDKFCIEDHSDIETVKILQVFERKFNLYVVFSVVYGFVFVNYIDIISGGFNGYHLWLIIMYFFPFITLSIFFPRNWQLTLGLGFIASLMNDLFYGVVRNLMGFPLDLKWYYISWLIPGNATLFHLNLGFAVLPVISWMMALSIYARFIVVFFLLRTWKIQAKVRCVNDARTKKKALLSKLAEKF